MVLRHPQRKPPGSQCEHWPDQGPSRLRGRGREGGRKRGASPFYLRHPVAAAQAKARRCDGKPEGDERAVYRQRRIIFGISFAPIPVMPVTRSFPVSPMIARNKEPVVGPMADEECREEPL